MLGLVRIALRRPYTFVVLAIFILIIGPLSAMRTPTDIFPDIRIPVLSVVWQYTGLPPDQMVGRITSPFERTLTTTVNDVEHIEAESVAGFGIRLFFQPRREYQHGERTGHRGGANSIAAIACGYDTTSDPELQRVDRTDHPTCIGRGPGWSRSTRPTSRYSSIAKAWWVTSMSCRRRRLNSRRNAACSISRHASQARMCNSCTRSAVAGRAMNSLTWLQPPRSSPRQRSAD
ncbi:acriflavin resistance protein [Caballeronia ptereochthonis]|uniref:Acriflavin resistance protein n=1 Tax=Caballeronia ptereochthonis TaxID=1777144 RepID=A0A158ATY5_9BURK|nr:acriflavin resistance protein [Caballeronia ptereochthonis]